MTAASLAALATGALLGSLITVGVLHAPSLGPVGQEKVRAPFYSSSVMQNGGCNVSVSATTTSPTLNVTDPNPEFPHLIGTAQSPHYGLHVVVLGADSKIWHKHQLAPGAAGNWSAWKCITPDFTKIPCSSAPHCTGYDNQPSIAWQPVNGTMIMFIRQKDDLVAHEFHLEDPKDPDSWSKARAPCCLCNWPPCQGQVNCGVVKNCDNLGVNCAKTKPSSRDYYFIGPVFPTSELTMQPDIDDPKKLRLWWRGFDGRYYSFPQANAGDAGGKWGEADGSMRVYNGSLGTIE